MTLHAAKGLEFEAVFLAGLEDGTLPYERPWSDAGPAERDAAEDEERRLCYVGMTRAKRRLTLSLARRRIGYGEGGPSYRSMEPSRFLADLPPELFGLASRVTPSAAPPAARGPTIRRPPESLPGDPHIELEDDGARAAAPPPRRVPAARSGPASTTRSTSAPRPRARSRAAPGSCTPRSARGPSSPARARGGHEGHRLLRRGRREARPRPVPPARLAVRGARRARHVGPSPRRRSRGRRRSPARAGRSRRDRSGHAPRPAGTGRARRRSSRRGTGGEGPRHCRRLLRRRGLEGRGDQGVPSATSKRCPRAGITVPSGSAYFAGKRRSSVTWTRERSRSVSPRLWSST